MALTKCPDCGNDVSTEAPACPKCGRPIAPVRGGTDGTATAGGAPKKPASLAKSLASLIVFAVILYFVWSGFSSPGSTSSDSSQTETQASVARPTYRTSVIQLYQDYSANEVLTDKKIGKALIEVSGTIASIDKDFLDHVVVHLETGDQFEQAGMTLVDSQKNAAANLVQGQQITVRCDTMHRIVGSPQGGDCVIVGQSTQ